MGEQGNEEPARVHEAGHLAGQPDGFDRLWTPHRMVYIGGQDKPADSGEDAVGAVLALACLVLGSIVPYTRARAEGLGMRADVGIAERADRLVLVLTTTAFVGLGLPPAVLTVVLGVLALASLVTVVQRVEYVRRQFRAAADGSAPPS